MSKPLPMRQRKEQEEGNKHQAARTARSAAASAQAGEGGRVQKGIQEEIRYRRDDLTRRASLRNEKELSVVLYNGLPDRAQFAEAWRKVDSDSFT